MPQSGPPGTSGGIKNWQQKVNKKQPSLQNANRKLVIQSRDMKHRKVETPLQTFN
jgi:hypothetical protein